MNWKKAAYIAVGVVLVAVFGFGAFRAGSIFNDRGAAQFPVITTEGDIGYLTLISPAESDLLAINGITGEKVPFLPSSDMNMLDPEERYLFTSHEAGPLSGVTRIDLQTGKTDIILGPDTPGDFSFNNLDGLIWTPWGSLLVGEETTGGRVFEVHNPLADPAEIQFTELTAFGKRRHEGLAIDSRGYLYGVDEVSGGGIYRFRPDSPLTPGSFSAGQLEVLVTEDNTENLERGRIEASWEAVAIEDRRDRAEFNRPEDIEIVGSTLYVAITASNEIISIDLTDPDRPTIGLFASAGTNAPGLTWPDNLASDPDGNIYIAENISLSRFSGQKNQLWFASAGDPLQLATDVQLVATLNTPRNEFSGILVDSAGERLYTNVLGLDNFILALIIDR